MSRYPELDISAVRRYSVAARHSKVHADSLARPHRTGDSFASFFKALPDILVARELREFVDRLVEAKRARKSILLMMGAHVIKVGLSPILIDLLEQGVITCVAANGAVVIHDTELCLFGQTSEEVADGLADGSFGMALETGEFINRTVRDGNAAQLGFGEAVGKRLLEENPPGVRHSLLANAYRLGIPVTVHVGIGTDIIHQHPDADGEAIGGTSLRDFRILAAQVVGLHGGGAVINAGSNVMMPEVFLKALTVARNVQPPVADFFTANFDMIQHYRPRVNVVQRPTLTGGKGYNFIGHHEIMLPLLAAAVKERLAHGA